ncbi:MAG: transglutaminase family protein [Roseobacter sp.]
MFLVPASTEKHVNSPNRFISVDTRKASCNITRLSLSLSHGFALLLSIETHLLYATNQPCDVLLQIEALSDSAQRCENTRLTLRPECHQQVIEQERDVGARRWISAGPQFECRYETRVEITRSEVDLKTLSQTPRPHIPGDVIEYMMPSRYCHSDQFLDFVAYQFNNLTGGALVSAIDTWIKSNFTYDSSASFVGTTATDSFASLSGVCRDYAHVLIALVRAGGIPARFVSVYAPDVTPQDFHALVEVYLEDAWHIVDPTGMAKPSEVARIRVGRDAADASFLTSYGWVNLVEQSVKVTRVPA